MKTNLYKSLKLLSLLFVLLLSIGMVFASDDNLMDQNNDDLALSNEKINNIDNDVLIESVYAEYGPNDVFDLDSAYNSVDELKAKSDLSSSQLSSVVEVLHTGDDLSDIQSAINSANVGDTVSLGDYSYDIGDGQINLTKRISLEGNGNTVINASGGVKVGCVLSVNGITGASIKGIRFNNPTADLSYTDYDTLYGWAIRLDSSNQILVENCSFINFNREINIDGSNENTISNCYFTGGATRVTNGNGKERGTRSISFSSNSWNNTISNSIFEGPVLDAINIDAAHNTLISGNTFINNTYAIFLDQAASDGAVISNNTFIDCGHFDAIYDGAKIHFEDLPIIDCAKSFTNLTIDNNLFYVSSNNIVIYVDTTSEIGNVNITDNKVDLLSNYKNYSKSGSSSGSSLSSDSSKNSSYNITFIKFPSVESKLDLTDHIVISGTEVLDEDLASDLTYGNFGGSLHYLSGGDIIIYGPRKNSSLDIQFAEKVYINSIVLNISLFDEKSPDVGLNQTVIVELNGNEHNVSLTNGFGQLNVAEDEISSGNYTVDARFSGDFAYAPSNCIKDLEILGHNTISVEHTGNDTSDILNAIDKANPNDIIDLGTYDYVLDTVTITKSLKFIGTNASISLSNSSSCIFYIDNKAYSSGLVSNTVNDSSGLVSNTVSNSSGLVSNCNGGYISNTANNTGLVSNASNNTDISNTVNNSGLVSNCYYGNISLRDSALGIIDLEISNILFKVSKNNETIVLTRTNDDISLFELDNITVVLDESLRDISNDTINLIRIESSSSAVSFDKINLRNNKLLGGMKSVLISSISERKSSRLLYSDMATAAVASADGRVGKYFEAVLTDAMGNPLSDRLVQIGFNGKVYNKTSNATGGVKLQINLPRAGLYTFAVCFLGDDDYNGSFGVALINVTKQTPKLTASAKTFKASAKTKTISVTFKTVKGNPISSKKISITINGKTYSAKTNSKGIASVRISLTKKGTYTATAKYAGDTTFKATSTKFSVKIT